MKNLKYLLAITLFSASVWAGGTVSNGGDIVRCAGSSKWVSLDYLLTDNLFGRDTKLISTMSLEKSLSRISKLIQDKLPQFTESFKVFVSDLDNHSDKNRNYIWVESVFELEDIYDESVDHFPSKCRLPGMGVGEKKQIVIRTELVKQNSLAGLVQFRYDSNAFAYLASLQKSFIVVHEWLWGLSKDVAANRKINYFLHSDLIDRMSTEQVAEQMQKFGL